MKIEQLTPQQWKLLSEKAHLVVFSEKNVPEQDRLDYALLCVEDKNVLGYLTAREVDAETVHWQFGGAFPGTKGSYVTFQGYKLFVTWTQERYRRITTYIENTNLPMLKFAFKVGFLVQGVRAFRGKILLDLNLEFPNDL